MYYTPTNLHSKARITALMLLMVLSIESAFGQEKPAAAGTGREQQVQSGEYIGELELGKAVELELKGGAAHVYGLRLAADQFVNLVVHQRGIDVVVILIGPGDKKVVEVDSPNGTEGPETVLSITDVPGDYRLKITSPEKKAVAGRYTVKILDVHAASAADRTRLTDLEEAARQNEKWLKLYNAGKYNEAIEPAERVLSLREQALGPQHYDVGRSLHNLGLLYWSTGDYARAEASYRRALAIAEQALGPEHSYVTTTLHNLAILYDEKGDHAQAERLYRRALANSERVLGPEHPIVAATLSELGLLNATKGDYGQAEALHQRALAIREKAFAVGHPTIAISLTNLASLYTQRGDYERAEPLQQRALAIYEKAFGPDHSRVATALNNLAILFKGKRDYKQALPLAERALKIREKSLGADHFSVATSLSTLAGISEAMGEYEIAQSLYQRALAIYQRALGPEHPDVARTLNDLAALFNVRGDTAEAVRLQERGNEIREQNLVPILATGSEEQKRLYLETLADETDGTVSLHVSSAPNDVEAARLSFTTVLRRKGRVLDAMSDSLGALRRRLSTQDRQVLEQLFTAYSQYAALSNKGLGSAAPAERRAAASQLRSEIEQLEAVASSRSAEFRVQTQPVTLESVQKALPQGSALVEIMFFRPLDVKAKTKAERYGGPRYVAYVLLGDGPPRWVDLGEAEVIDRDAAELRRALNDPRLPVKRLAHALDEKLMRPIRRLLGNTRRVFISPDGALNLLPLGALVDERGQYLIENYSFTYLTSGRDLLRLKTSQRGESAAVLVGDPAFDVAVSTANASALPQDTALERRSADLEDARLTPLPATRQEVERIKALLPKAQMLLGAEATEAAAKRVFHPRILHVATHGFFLKSEPASSTSNVENPLLRSGLFLAGASKRQSGQGEDGVLTALEVAGLDLWGTKLVVLSACETGLGDVRNGEGVYGLRRALVLAGSETQVMSLWKVSDAGTRDLMTDYYMRLQRGEGRSEALRQVQLAMLQGKATPQTTTERRRRETSDTLISRPKDYRHPYYWAAFIQSGDWRNMDGK